MMKLVGQFGSPFVRRMAIALHDYGAMLPVNEPAALPAKTIRPTLDLPAVVPSN